MLFETRYKQIIVARKRWNFFAKKCLTSPCGGGIVNKLSQGIASEILKNK